MKRFLAFCISAIIAMGLIGCGNSENEEGGKTSTTTNTSSTTTTTTVTASDDGAVTGNPYYDNNQPETETTPDYDFTLPDVEPLEKVEFNRNLAVCLGIDNTAYSYAVLCTDGSVKTMGDNSFSQLGVGDFDVHDGWQLVNISDIKQVYPFATGFVALSNGGKLYYWGGANKEPTLIETNVTIDEIVSEPHEENWSYVAKTVDGEYYLGYFTKSKDGRASSPTLSLLNNLPLGATHIKVSGHSGSKGRYVYNGHFYAHDLSKSDPKYVSVTDNVVNYDDESSNKALITDTGAVVDLYSIGDYETVEETSLGGKGYKEFLTRGYSRSYSYNEINEYSLFNNGKLETRGSNDYGQLGDGSKINSQDNLIIMNNVDDIIEYNCSLFALTKDNELYAWGKHFSSTPTLIISEADFYNN